jgi:hypothetical protein
MNRKTLPAPPRQADDRHARSAARISDRLTEQIDAAVEEARFSSTGRAVRSDGWTPERVRTFLEALADCGSVTEAAAAAGMTPRGAYALRRRARARAFHMAWLGVMNAVRHRLADELMARAIKGNVDLVIRDGVVVAERHRHDNALGLAMLKRLDQQQAMLREEIFDARLISEELDEFIDIVCDGDGEEAAQFIVARRPVPNPEHSREAGLMARLAAYLGRKPEV